MAIFVVLSEEPNPALGSKIASVFPHDHFQFAETQWAVSANKLTSEVAEALGIPGGPLGRVVVFKTDGYNGWHIKKLWEWLELKEKQ